MNILLIGQCTLHLGRMEFGNIGNYYIIESFVRELHNTFPLCKIKSTLQMSKRFSDDEKIEVIPMGVYYGWQKSELESVRKELSISESYKVTGKVEASTPYINAVMWADLVIDFSGDIWGDNANFLGENRFLIGLLKDKIAKNFGKKTVMLAGSPGPFSDEQTKGLAKEIYGEFDLVTNREPISTKLLEQDGFDVSKTQDLACPAFLFESPYSPSFGEVLLQEGLEKSPSVKPVVGFILCGWNFELGPFDKWPRNDVDYNKFVEAVEFISEELNARVCLMSHSNGFEVPPAKFELKQGRDYPIAKHLEKIIIERGVAQNVFVLEGVYDAWQTKAIVGSFDMLVSGRVHAAVAALSQNIPTVIIDYGHEPKAHKLLGFAAVVGVQEYVANPCNSNDLKDKIRTCWENRSVYKKHLEIKIPTVKEAARQNFRLLKELFV